jgi:Ran GTPase-activating protein (RanGAP) involved in mRNA processing and transport
MLCLSKNSISDAGAMNFAHALIINQSIRDLLLFDNEIGDEGAKRLAKALEANHTINNLDLSGNKISIDVLRILESCHAIQL